MKKTLTVFGLSLLLAACHSSLDSDTNKANDDTVINQQESNSVPDMHTAEDSLSWAGEYEGLLPCADCEGIQTKLTLTHDKTYTLEEHYVKNGEQLHPTKIDGKFAFDEKQTSLIRLDENAEQRAFFVGENFVEARDKETGEKLSQKLNYTLKKTK